MYLNNHRAIAAMNLMLTAEYATPTEKVARARTATRRAVMIRAWEIARLAANTFGGTAHAYIAGAMSQAWAEHRGECDAFSADATLYRILARGLNAPTQRNMGRGGRQYYAAAVGW